MRGRVAACGDAISSNFLEWRHLAPDEVIRAEFAVSPVVAATDVA
jgi:hypothetical protein